MSTFYFMVLGLLVLAHCAKEYYKKGRVEYKRLDLFKLMGLGTVHIFTGYWIITFLLFY